MFNTSTRKDDLSVKLRAQNMKNTREMTRKLESESRRMEERLQELKMAMTREKEEREAKGGGFWKAGQEGNLGNYVQDVLNKPAKKSASSNRERSSKSSRVKVLKDEPIVVPNRNKGPGTMKNIALQNASANKDKIKGPKCGQCEQKKAHVTCQECGEDYCAGCFAAFHLKGALKKHRSTPIGNNGMRPSVSPRPILTARSDAEMRMDSLRIVNSDPNSHQKDYNDNQYQNEDYSSPAKSPESKGVSGGGSLLNGDYDEAANEAEFQAALRAWREGRTESGANDVRENKKQSQRITPRRISPRKSEATSTETGTDMVVEKRKPVEITFSSNSSLTYAERLLLKRNRRKEVGMLLPNSEQNSTKQSDLEEEHVDFDEVVGLITPRDGRESALDPFLRSAHVTGKPLEYHVADDSLTEDMRSESRVSIIEVGDNVPVRRLRHFDQSSDYQVKEGPDIPSFYPNDQTSMWSPMDRTPTPPKEGKHRYAFATPPSSGRPSPSGRPRSSASRRSYVISPISAAMKQNKENLSALSDPNNSSLEGIKTVMSQSVLLSKGISTTISGKDSPITSARKTPRPKSSARQRPSSRAKFQAGSRAGSRASSRASVFGEGILTKGPSDSLKEVARLAGQLPDKPEYAKSGLTDFFTVGVKPIEQRERTMTPSGQRKAKQEEGIPKWRVSNKLYTMSAKSWRPDSSLGDNIEIDQATRHLDDRAVQQLEAKVSEGEIVALTPRDELGLASIAPRVEKRESSNMSGRNSSQKHVDGVRVSTQDSYDQVIPQVRDRERSEIARERTVMRERAAEQDDDIFPDDSRPTSGLQRFPPSSTRSSGVGTPRTMSSRPNSRTKRPDSGRPISRTPRPDSGRPGYLNRPLSQTGRMTPEGRATPTRPTSSSGRESRAVLPDGDDLTKFDEVELKDLMNADDAETIEQLEWELASQEGRITAEGKLSRMSLIDPDLDEGDLGIVVDDGPGSGLSSPDPDNDLLDRQLRESVLMEDFDEMEDRVFADEVKALK